MNLLGIYKLTKMETDMEKITQVRLPFDRRNEAPGKNYGIGGLRIWFVLKGPKGAVQFMCGFPTYLPHVEAEGKVNQFYRKIEGWDVGYHAKEPQYEGQSQSDCEHFDSGKCYYDGSGLRAEEWAKEIFSVTGKAPEDLLWKKLEEEYELRFGDKNGEK